MTAPPLLAETRLVSALEAIVLGLTQGLTEFLPISSTAHLRVIPAFAGWDDPGAAFTAVTQLGTMAAVLLFFRRDLLRIANAWLAGLRDPAARRSLDGRLGWYILLGTVPIGLAGLAFKDQIETGARSLHLIGATLILLGLILLLAERVARRQRGIGSLRLRDGLVIGGAQALALVPGVSRSGATITAGLFLGLDRASAARYSFLLSVPAVVLSGSLEFASIVFDRTATGAPLGALAVATALAFVSGYATIALLLRFLTTHSTAVFVGYRVALGAIVLLAVGVGLIA
jgi:undecaprenyl-diphosphatase